MRPNLAALRLCARTSPASLLGAVLVIATVALAGDTKLDDRGWHVVEGAMGSGQSIVLSGGGPYAAPQLDVSLISADAKAADLDELVTRPALIFYYSAGCPHCVHVAPELPLIAARLKDRADVIAIASGSNSLGQLREFGKAVGFGDLPHYKDFSRKYAAANKILSTPTVLLVQPSDGGGFESLGEFRPFYGGAGLIAEIRLRVALGDDPYAAFEKGRYYGSRACGTCHVEEYGSWGLTHHSLSYWTIYERELTQEKDCVNCHVTGLDEPGGFVLGDDGSELAEVGCEACHGSGGPHAGFRRPLATSREACLDCHDADHSLVFDPTAALVHVDHYKAAVLDPEAFQAARVALLEGRADQPLLAFPEGRNLGVEPCRACHAEEVASWEEGPHAGAMKTLKRKGSHRDAGCVACHAVARVEAPKKAADYYPEGVGCEACHGPGEKHVASEGNKADILGLGTTCPECILEGVCTRCHAPEHDPDWELKAALEQVKH